MTVGVCAGLFPSSLVELIEDWFLLLGGTGREAEETQAHLNDVGMLLCLPGIKRMMWFCLIYVSTTSPHQTRLCPWPSMLHLWSHLVIFLGVLLLYGSSMFVVFTSWFDFPNLTLAMLHCMLFLTYLGVAFYSASTATQVNTLELQGPVYAKELIVGGAAGAIAKTAVAPLERVKICRLEPKGFNPLGSSDP
ncbi:hypothetical protein ACQ4PT_069819 [Festuca glaucescens]